MLNILKKIRKSLRLKLLLSFLFVSLVPFAILITYTLFLTQTKIVTKSIKEQYNRADNVAHLIHMHLKSLEKELSFLASLDLMDDILADDIDKRVSILLSKKASDLGEHVYLFIVDAKDNIIAANKNQLLSQSFALPQKSAHNFFIKKDKLYIYAKIYASFDSTKFLGNLVLEYDLNNLAIFLTHQEDTHSYLSNNKKSHIGDKTKLAINLSAKRADILTEEHLIVYEKLDSFLEDYYLVYAVDKSLALKFLYDFISFMLYVSTAVVIIIVFLALRYSKNIVLPIEKLTNTTQRIRNKQDYSHVLTVESSDEIGVLTSSFNDMLKTTSLALEKLEEENRLRLQRFIQLIEVFNRIIQTQDEKECINVAMKEIRNITSQDNLEFLKTKTQYGVDLYVTDFEKKKKVYFGSISLALDNFKDENEQSFYTSIANMIMLQLDKIRLTQRTEAVSHAKSAFISNMSHELRTPLNAIIGSTQFLIAYENITDDQQDTVANIETSAHYLLNMINEILDIAKIEAGKMEIHKEKVDIALIATNSYNMLQPLAEDKGLEFEIFDKNVTDLIVNSDVKIAQQIIINLLSNAIKFTDTGFVKIELSKLKNKIILKIIDSGIGISQENIPFLFQEFTQVESEMQKKHKGTGIGLALSKKMADLLEVELTLESDGLGKGTTACVTFCI